MIEKRTVLILGAGSSYEVGFPLGKELIRQIYAFVQGNSLGYRRDGQGKIIDKVLSNATLLWTLLEITGVKKENGGAYSVDDIKHFAHDLWDAQPDSIDDFLFNRREYSLIGKLCVLFVLSGYENTKRFQPFQEINHGTIAIPREYESRTEDYIAKVNLNGKWQFSSFGWYEYLWGRLQEGTGGDFEKLKQNKLSVITFNYDRSLEHFLFTAIKATYGLQQREADAADFFINVPVKHVYGELGVLPWKFNYLQEYRNQNDALNDFSPWEANVLFRLYGNLGEYGMTRDDWEPARAVLSEQSRLNMAKMFVARAKEIKTYHEFPQRSDCTEILKNAERIYFLGCGYHEQNIQVLGLDKEDQKTNRLPLSSDVEIFGTAIGMSDIERENIMFYVASFSGGPNKVNIESQWEGIGSEEFSKITSFLRNIAPLE